MMFNQRKKISPIHYFLLIVLILFLFGTFIKVPYYVTSPGEARDISKFVKVEGSKEDKGAFMLTTVRMGPANLFQYAIARVSKYQELYPTGRIRMKGETDQQYNERQIYMMQSSKDIATIVAYQKAGKKVQLKDEFVMVGGLSPKMPAAKVLKINDKIRSVDGQVIHSTDDLFRIFSTKKSGDQVTLVIERGGEEKSVTLPLKPIEGEQGRVGIGIQSLTIRKVITDPKITIDTEKIGGPSAGLMFTMEIYNQLTGSNLTKGYKVAGTGTIDINGNVGPIGGIEQKIVAAEKAGADLFFAPNEHGKKDSDYNKALKTAKDIDAKMKIIPVDTFDQAVDYMKNIKER